MPLQISFIEFAAAKNSISLRGVCVCNPGRVAAMMGIQKEMVEIKESITKKKWEKQLKRELGIVRISFGLVSNFQDAWNVSDSLGTRKREASFGRNVVRFTPGLDSNAQLRGLQLLRIVILRLRWIHGSRN
jgi:hypothetical protein